MLEEFEDTKGVIRIRKSKKVVQNVRVRLLNFSTTLSSQWVFFLDKKISITKENGQVFVFITGLFSIFFFKIKMQYANFVLHFVYSK